MSLMIKANILFYQKYYVCMTRFYNILLQDKT